MQFHFHTGGLRFKVDTRRPDTMAIDTVRTGPDHDDQQGDPTVSPRIIEVTDLPPEDLSEFARKSDRAEVYLERKGGDTYLVA